MIVHSPAGTLQGGPIVLYDGECGLCDRSVQMLLRNDPRGRLRYAALQGETGGELMERHGLTPKPGQGFASMILIVDPDTPRERALLQSEAALAMGRVLGGGWASLSRFGELVPAGLRNLVYDLIARNRHRWFPAPEACLIPKPGERARFLP